MTAKANRIKIGRIIAVILLIMTLVMGMIPREAYASEIKVADAATVNTYMDSLGDGISTEYAGRIWTDKSVFGENAEFTLKNGNTQTIVNNDNEDFLVSYSALSTTQQVSGATKAPVDVMFIVDTSGSMTSSMSSSDSTKRIVNTVSALNNALDQVLTMNPYTRVGVSAFSSDYQGEVTSEVLLPLGRYEKGTRITGSGYNSQTITDYFSLNSNNTTLYVHAKKEGTNTTVTTDRAVKGGTHIQRGLYEGMNILATEETTTAVINNSVVKRIPSVVLLSDGAPTFSSVSKTWWQPDADSQNGDGSNPYYGNGIKALMVGAYMKNAIDRNYEVTDSIMATTMYTIGMGITGLSNYSGKTYTGEQDLANMTLAPYMHWTDDNAMTEAITEDWSKYITNNGTPSVKTDDNQTYEITHPSMNDIDNDADALKNLVKEYFPADNAAALENVFKTIINRIAISAPEVPTEMKSTDALSTGYITYTDPVGKYMEVKSIKGILFDGVYYPASEDGTVSGDVETTLYGKQNLSNVLIETSGTPGVNQKLQIKIPAALIPLRVNTVMLNEDESVKTHTHNGTLPVRVVYSVGLIDDVATEKNGERIVDLTQLSEDYLAKHFDQSSGYVSFYSNLYTEGRVGLHQHTAGDANAEFEPARSNPFYYVQKDEPIYKDEAGKNKVSAGESLDDNTTYYTRMEYYHGKTVETEIFKQTGAELKNAELKTIDGYLYRSANSPRLNRILTFAGHKSANTTKTAEDFYYPTFDKDSDDYTGKYVTYLGNNGKLSLPGSGALEISKTVKIGDNLNPSTDAFTFTVDFNGEEQLEGVYEYQILETKETGTITDGGRLILKDGQTARIEGLSPGTTYIVTEADYSEVGFTTAKSGDKGTIIAGLTSEAKFENTYGVQPVVYPAESTITGTKQVVGRTNNEWLDGETFTFEIKGEENKPLPDFTTATVTKEDADRNGHATFSFGQITFTEPGEYTYTISEVDPMNHLPGMTYSQAVYELKITVVDNGVGELVIPVDGVILKQVADAGGNEVDNVVTKTEYVNSYSAEKVSWGAVATKNYTDTTGQNPFADGKFSFTLKPNRQTPNAPMPVVDGKALDVIQASNVGTQITFHQITFTEAGTYYYDMQETSGTENGMAYDDKVYTVKVEVINDQQEGALKVVATYLDGEQPVDAVAFYNTYDPADARVELRGTKLLESADGLNPDDITFEFKVEAANDSAKTVLEAAQTVSTQVTEPNVENDFAFNSISFSKPGIYVFNITENPGSAKGVTYDGHVTVATVVVTDDASGTLKAEVSYDNKNISKDTDEAKFVNTYAVKPVVDSVALTGTKTLTGRTLHTGEFFFDVYDELNQTTYKVSNVEDDADGEEDGTAAITFLKDVEFTKPGTYTYIISENDDSPAPGVTYDSTQYRYTIDVVDDGEGSLSITNRILEINIDGSWNEFEGQITFKNSYNAQAQEVAVPLIKKVLSGNRIDAMTAGEFVFELELVSATPEDGIVMPQHREAVNAADGTVTFDEKVRILKGGEYTLEISEKIPEGLTENADGTFTDATTGITYSGQSILVKFIANDDGKGNLSVVSVDDPSGMTITNEYHTEGNLSGAIKIEKILTGRGWLDTDNFTFEVIPDSYTAAAIEAGDVVLPTADGDTVTSVTINKNTEAHTEVYPDITFHKAGEYGFTIREIIGENGEIGGITYDSNTYNVEIVASDNSDGTLSLTVTDDYGDATDGKVSFENMYDPESTSIPGNTHLIINKIFTGRIDDAWLDTDAFTFHLTAKDVITTSAIENGAIEMPAETTLVINKDNREHPHFGNIIFHQTGEYHFAVTEEQGNIEGVSYDTTERVITVAVTDDGSGVLTATVTDADSLTFRNTYYTKEVVLDGSQNLTVEKLLTGREWFDSDEFTFTLSAREDSVTQEAIDTGNIIMPNDLSLTITKADKNDDGKYIESFGDITFKVPGEYIFEVRETKGEIEGITYDEHCTEIVVTVEDDTIGNLVASAPTYSGSMIFENVYKPKEIQIPIGDELNGKKLLEGRDLTEEDEFAFRISKAEGSDEQTPMPAALEVTNEGNQISFGTITYTKPGTYIYTIKEEEGILPGISYDKGIVTATVEVAYDASTGLLNASVSYEKTEGNGGEGFTFINKYESSPTDPINLSATKTVTPAEGHSYVMTDGDFEFEILPAEANPKADPITHSLVPVKGDGSIFFGDVVFTQAGTYVYTIHEVMGNRSGIGYDPSVYDVTVVVTDNEAEAKLYADVFVTKDGVAADSGISGITFDNHYEPKATSAIIYGKKVLTSEHKELSAADFEFKLTAEEGIPMPAEGGEIATNTEAGLFQFGLITYTVPGTYSYTVSEINGGKQGYTYDPREYTVTVTVEDIEGVLSATTEGVLDAEGQPSIVFENKYEPERAYLNIEGTKKLSVPVDSPRTLRVGEFAFELLDEKGTVVGNATNDETGRFNFADVEFTKAGTYNYKIVEKNSGLPGVTDDPVKEFPVKIDVVDDAGLLRATATFPQGDAVFTNTYAPLDVSIQLSGIKILEGRQLEKGEFTFIMTDENGKEVSKAVNDETGVVTFDPISYASEGTYQYQIAEVKGNADRVKYDNTVYNVKVIVKDGGGGYLVATIEQKEEAIVFTNIYDAVEPYVTITKTQAVNGGTPTTEKLQVNAGDKVTYYLTVSNAEGVGVATNVRVTDKVPTGLDVVEISGNGVNRDGTIVWNLSPMSGGEKRTVSFTVKVPAVEVDTRWENVATVAYDDPGDQNDTTPDEPSLKNETPVPVVIEENIEPLLTIKKKASKTKVEPGDVVTYTITAKNVGNCTAANVVITDEIPRGLTVTDFSEGGVNQMSVVSWYVGTLKQGESKSVKVSVVVPEVDKDTSWKNIAIASYDESADPSDPTSSNEPKDPVLSEQVIIMTDVEETQPVVPVEPEEPDVPPTGDPANLMLWLMGLAAACTGFIGMRVRIKRNN